MTRAHFNPFSTDSAALAEFRCSRGCFPTGNGDSKPGANWAPHTPPSLPPQDPRDLGMTSRAWLPKWVGGLGLFLSSLGGMGWARRELQPGLGGSRRIWSSNCGRFPWIWVIWVLPKAIPWCRCGKSLVLSGFFANPAGMSLEHSGEVEEKPGISAVTLSKTRNFHDSCGSFPA